MAEGDTVTATVTLLRDASGRITVSTDPPGLVPDGADVETALLCLGGALMTRLLSVPRKPVERRFGRNRPSRPQGTPE